MKILLIGHEGYLGRGLHAYFQRRHQVLGWDRKEDLFKLDAMTLVREQIEAVVNLSVMAERGSGRYQIDAPTDQVNVGGARHLVKILKGSGLPWIQMSTREVLGLSYRPDEVIETAEGYRPRHLVDESAPFAPQTFYGKSKVVAEFIAESHPESAIIRLTTCYTDHDHPGGNWMVSMIRNSLRRQPITLNGGGRQFRDPLHVEDLGRLMEAIIAHRAFGECFHAGGGSDNLISLREFVLRANPDAEIIDTTGGDLGFAFDNRKAERLTGWCPEILVRERIPVLVRNITESLAEKEANALATTSHERQSGTSVKIPR